MELEKAVYSQNQAEGTEYTKRVKKNLYLLEGESEKLLKNLTKLLADHDYIDNPSIWLDHFNSIRSQTKHHQSNGKKLNMNFTIC